MYFREKKIARKGHFQRGTDRARKAFALLKYDNKNKYDVFKTVYQF